MTTEPSKSEKNESTSPTDTTTTTTNTVDSSSSKRSEELEVVSECVRPERKKYAFVCVFVWRNKRITLFTLIDTHLHCALTHSLTTHTAYEIYILSPKTLTNRYLPRVRRERPTTDKPNDDER